MIEKRALSGDIYNKIFFNDRGRSNSPSTKDVALTHIYYAESDQILFVHDEFLIQYWSCPKARIY
jgi:hypothetical protein